MLTSGLYSMGARHDNLMFFSFSYLSGSELPRDFRYQQHLFLQDKYGNVDDIYTDINRSSAAADCVAQDFTLRLSNLLAIIAFFQIR